MADRTQLKVVDNNDIADDDPFAELTRIMGFDPRQPARPQAPERSAQQEPTVGEADFDIDLEKELMGEFDFADEAPVPQAAAPALAYQDTASSHEPIPSHDAVSGYDPVSGYETVSGYDSGASDDELAAALEQDFVFDDPADHFAVAHAPEPVADIAFDDDFDQAVASSFEAQAQVPAQHEEVPPQHEVAVAADVAAPHQAPLPHEVAAPHDDLSIEQEMAASLDHGFQLDHHEPTVGHDPAAAFDADFDHAAHMSLDDEMAFEDRADEQGHDAATVQPAEHHAAAYHAPADDFDTEFDEAMADVEMDFDQQAEPEPEVGANHAHPEETAAQAAYFAPEPVVEPEPEPVAGHALDDDFERSFHDALADEPAELSAQPVGAFKPSFVEAPVVAAAAPVVAAAPAVAAGERSLEDELNALLGAMTARPVPAPAPAAREPVPMPQPVVQPASHAAQETAVVDDLDWDLDEEEPAQDHAEADLDTLLADELDRHGFAAVGAAAHAEPGIDFDDAAFDAAFAKGIEAAPVEAAEPSRSWSRMTPVPGQVSFAAQAEPAAPQMAMPAYRKEPAKDYPAYVKAAPVEQPVYREEPAEDYPVHAKAAPAGQAPRRDEVPDVETVDVPERVVALADDLDIPELSFEEDQPAAPAYDDLDAEFATLLTEINATEIAAAPVQGRDYEDGSYNAGFNTGYDRRELRAETPAVPAAASYAAAASQFDEDDLPGSRPVSQSDDFAVDELDYDPELDEAMTVPGLAEREAARPRGRGRMLAVLVGAVVIAGGLGALAFSFGGKGGSEAPVIVMADNSPIKVKPENPGGAVVPNQDNKVYDAVAKGGGAKPAEPVQEKLVTSNEVPVDVASKEPPASRVVDLSPDAATGADAAGNPDAQAAETAGAQQAAPAPKSEDRIAQVLQDADKGTNNDVVAVAPRKVKTMMVKPDGSLVAREDQAPKVAAAEPSDPAPQHVATAGQSDTQQTGTVAPASAQQADDQGADDQAATVKPAKAAKAEGKVRSTNTPAKAPVAPPRPSDQPVDIVGEVKPDQVASIDTAAAAGGGSWSMQIASQPTVDSAQSTYQDLQRRYGSVLAGRTANIVKAEVAGKGTFYRVRVPAQSRNDAINLCTSYKAAGGTCFVSR